MITTTMKRVANGELDAEVPFSGRHDEIGESARAVQMFRDNARQLVSIQETLRSELSSVQETSGTLAQEIEAKTQDLEGATLELTKARRTAEMLAIHDELTGLLNRRGLFQKLEALQRDAKEGATVEIAALDLDGFKGVNDTLGHDVGDDVLKRVANLLRDLSGEEVIAARMGGDEFVLASVGALGNLPKLCDSFITQMRIPMTLRGREVRLGSSAGLASATAGDDTSIQDLFIDADTALYEAKRKGKNRSQKFDAELRKRRVQEKTLADELARGLDNDEFEPFFEPQICPQTGAVIGAEALVRWRHPARGLLQPAAFLSTAEQAGCLGHIDRRVMELACDTIRRMEEGGTTLRKFSVNVSMQRIADPDLMQSIKSLPEMSTRLSLEIVEAVFFDRLDTAALWTIDAFRDAGVLLEVDDFGTGHASITALTQLRPDGVKIDRALVQPALEAKENRLLLSSVIQMTKGFDMHITAEGVETSEQADLLRELGVNALQGFYYAKAMSPEEFAAFAGPARATA